MKRSVIIVVGIILVALSAVGTTVLATQQKEGEQHNLKLIYNDKYIVDENINENSNVIIEYKENILHDLVLTKNEVVNLDDLELDIKLPNNKIISHWSIEEKEEQYLITPVLIEKSEIDITFLTMNGGSIKGESTVPSLTKTVEQGTKLKEVLPEIQSEENYHFAGWFTLEDIEKEVELKKEDQKKLDKLKSNLEKKEKQLSKEKKKDKKDKINKEIKKIKTEIEETETPEIEVINEYQPIKNVNEVVLDEDKEFIAVLFPDVNNNGKDDRKEEVKISVDFGLDNEVQENNLHVGQPIKLSQPYHDDYIFIDWFLDKGFTERLGEKKTFTSDTSIYAKWKTPKEIVLEGGENLIEDQRISDRVEQYLYHENKKIYEKQKKKSEQKEEKLKKKYEDETAQHTEKRYTLKNFKSKQTFLIKFYDNEEFLFSLALPYGRTLELLNENDQKVKEYGVRQESSIDLSALIKDSESLNFDVKTVTKNNAVITQIYPKNNNKEMD